MKEKRYLITTADERTWKLDQPVLFLGEWCRIHSRENVWSKMDAEVLPYHWEDFEKLFEDYKYLKKIYEEFLLSLSAYLNEIHGVDHNVRYWRILVGPWLACFIHILFDRWSSIQKAKSEYEITDTAVLVGRDQDALVPNDMRDFDSLVVGDEWNQSIFNDVVAFDGQLPSTNLPFNEKVQIDKYFVGRKRKFRHKLMATYTALASMFVRDSDAFLINTYLPPLSELRLQLRLMQFPQRWTRVVAERAAIDWGQRSWSISKTFGSEFERFVSFMIPRQLPCVFLEGYQQLVAQALNSPWPKNPKLIYTSNDLWYGTVSMAYAAEKVEQGTPLVYGQHGGVYGITRFSWAEEHETRISDRYLSWGWSDDSKKHVRPVGVLSRVKPPNADSSVKKKLLMVLSSNSRYSRMISSAEPLSSGLLAYYDRTYNFVDALPEKLKSALVVRTYMHELGWEQGQRWKDRFPEVAIDNGSSRMSDLVEASRLIIHTYNSTGYLEAMLCDTPTVLFWDPTTSPLRDSAIPYLDKLKQAGIYHETAESAALHVVKIWDDVETWWKSEIVREALEDFKSNYCNQAYDLLENIEGNLRDVIRA